MNLPGQIGKQTVKFLSPNFFFQLCADTHSFCDAIHSEDTNLFRFRRNPLALVVAGSAVLSSRVPYVGPIAPKIFSEIFSVVQTLTAFVSPYIVKTQIYFDL